MDDISDVVGVVLNPRAGHFRTEKGMKELEWLVGEDFDGNGFLKEKYGDRIVIGMKPKPEDIQYTCDEFIERNVSIILALGGDGTLQNIYTNYAKRLYQRKEKDREAESLIGFLKSINTQKGPRFPYIYNIKKGTVHVFSNCVEGTNDLEPVLDNAFKAFDYGQGTQSFRRLYVPLIICYSADEPDNINRTEIMFAYADAGIRRFYDQYYKDKGPGKPNMMTAYKLVAKALLTMPIPKSFVYRLAKKIPSNVEIDDRKLPIDKRLFLVASTINANICGFRPFWRRRKNFEDFERHYEKGEEETVPKDAVERQFHILTGDFDPWRIALALPNVIMGKPTKIKGLHDTMARDVGIEQLSSVLYIADGTRKEEGQRMKLTTGFEIGVPYMHEEPLLK